MLAASSGLGRYYAHRATAELFTNDGGGWEYPLFLAVATAVQVLLGPGALRVKVRGVFSE